MKAQLVTTKVRNLWPTQKDFAARSGQLCEVRWLGFVGLLPGGGDHLVNAVLRGGEKSVRTG